MLNSAMLIVLRKITLQDINTTPIEPKTERGCSRRQLFRHYCRSSGRRIYSLLGLFTPHDLVHSLKGILGAKYLFHVCFH